MASAGHGQAQEPLAGKEADDLPVAGKAADNTPTNPRHYSRWTIEPLDFISANRLDFLRGNIIKYIMRYDARGGVEDLEKARVYLDRLIEKESGKK